MTNAGWALWRRQERTRLFIIVSQRRSEEADRRLALFKRLRERDEEAARAAAAVVRPAPAATPTAPVRRSFMGRVWQWLSGGTWG